MFEALSLVVAVFGAGLVEAAPVGPVVGVRCWVVGVGGGGPEVSDLVT